MNSNRNMLRQLVIGFAAICLCSACGRNRLESQRDRFTAGATDNFGSVYVIYDEELKTGGGLLIFPGGENQMIDLENRENPFGGKQCIKYHWNGGEVFNYEIGRFQNSFAGFALQTEDDPADFFSSNPRDFSSAQYTKVFFHIRGALSENTKLKVEAPDDADTETAAPMLEITSLTNAWTQYSFNITPASLTKVKEFFKLTFIYSNPDGTSNSGEGGIVFVDNIFWQK